MRDKIFCLGAAHGVQGVHLLGAGGLKLAVAAAVLLNALDDGRQSVCRLQDLALGIVQHAAGQPGLRLGLQLSRLQAGHNAGALMLHSLVGGAQGIVFVLDGRGHVAGQNLRRIVVDSRCGHDLGPQGCAGAGAAFADQAERVRQHRRIGGMLAQRFGPGAAHQAPPCNVFHAAEQRTERIGFHLHLTSGLWYTGVAFSIPQLFEM